MAGKIVPLGDLMWGPSACLGAMLERAEAGKVTKVLVLAYDDRGEIDWATSNLTAADAVFAVETFKARLLQGEATEKIPEAI